MLARNFTSTIISNVAGLAIAFGGSVILARILGPEKRGIYDLAILVPNTIYMLSTLGLTTAHIVYAGKYPEKRGAIAFQSLFFSALMGILAVLFYLYALKFQPVWFQRFIVVGKGNLMLASTLVFLNLAMINFQSGILGANRIGIINIGTVLMPLSKLILVLLLVSFLKQGVTGGIWAQVGGFSSVVVLMVVATAKRVPLKTWLPDFKFIKRTVMFGMKVYMNTIAWLMLHTVDRYMIAYMIPNSDKDLGHYAVAAQLSAALWVLPQSLQTTFLPHLSVTASNKEQLTVKIVRIIFIVLLPVFIGCIALSPLITVILGEKYTASIIPFRIFIIGIMFYGSSRPLSSYLMHKEKPMYDTMTGWMGSGVNIILNWLLIPKMGIVGAAMASSVSAIFMAAGVLGFFIYETKLPLRSFLFKQSDFYEIFSILNNLVTKLKITADKIRG